MHHSREASFCQKNGPEAMGYRILVGLAGIRAIMEPDATTLARTSTNPVRTPEENGGFSRIF
jgi:hypothetical protein